MLNTDQLIVIGTLGSLILSLFSNWAKPALLFLLAAMVFLITGILQPVQLLQGLANQQVISIVLLMLISSALRKNYDLSYLFDGIFRAANSMHTFLLSMMGFVAAASAFINNTPMVAIMTPYVYHWGKKHQIAPSKLLIPLSYATILGGTITLVGTSTNLVMQGFLEQNNLPLLIFTDFLYLGLLVTVIGLVFILIIGHYFLPDNKDKLDVFKESAREYLVETRLAHNSELIGKTVSEARLRNLKGVYLVDIIRNDKVISPVAPKEPLLARDKLIFAGDTKKIVELVKNNTGLLLPNPNGNFIGNNLDITEVVIPANSPLTSKIVKDSDFRNDYDAAIVAIHRNGARLRGKIGDMRLQVGDLLLLTTGGDFYKRNDALKGLYVISKIRRPTRENKIKNRFFLGALFIIVVFLMLGYIKLFLALMLLFSSLIILKMYSIGDIRKDTDLDLVAILVCALAIGTATIDTGVAPLLANGFMDIMLPFGQIGLLIGLFLLTVLLTTFITNAAAVSIVFPIAYSLCTTMDIAGTPYYLAIAFAASCAFLTPIGYQTNLMVYGPGGYRFVDYFRIGLPLTIIYSLTCLLFITLKYQII